MAMPLALPDRNRLANLWSQPAGLIGWLSAVQSNYIGLRMIVTSFIFLLIGGVLALLIRIQLVVPRNDFLSPELFNQFFTMHGTTMMFLFAIPMAEGLGNYLIPQMIGSRDLPFPRAGAFGYWCLVFGGIFLYSSFLVGAAPDIGWFAYVPLSGPRYSGLGTDFWLLGTTFIEFATITAAIELIVAVFKLRAPGMAMSRLPIFAWSILVMAFMILIGFIPLIAGEMLLELDRLLGTRFYDPVVGGNALLWQHLFWIFGHPEVYVMLMPGLGIVSTLVITFSRRPLVGYAWVVAALVAVGFISFGLWVHHMFAVGLPALSLALFGAASLSIVIANGANYFASVATIWHGRVSMKTPFLFILGFFVIFILGGVTGAMIGSAPFDLQVHDTYFIVAHFHYVIFGGVIFPVFAAIYYWFPHISGRMFDERLGALSFWVMFIGANLTFFPMHISGFLGMPRRVYTYSPDLGIGGYNVASTIGAFVFALGVLIVIVTLASAQRDGPTVGPNPWGAPTLEWGLGSPPNSYSYRAAPVVRGRYPLWDQPDLPAAMERGEPSDDALPGLSATRRETFGTTLMDAIPDQIVVLAESSLLPISLALSAALFFTGTLTQQFVLSALALPLAIAILAAWHWPREREVEEDEGRVLPVEVSDSRSTAWWGMALALVALGVFFVCFVIAYFYLAGNNRAWPPPGIPRPQAVVPIVGAALGIAAAVAARVALFAVERRQSGRLLLSLGLALLLGLASLGVLVFEIVRQPFGVDTHAYASAFLVILGAQAVQLAVGALVVLAVLVWAWRGYYDERRHLAVRNASLFWIYVAAAWIVVLAVLYLSPYVLQTG